LLLRNPLAVTVASTYIVPKEGGNLTVLQDILDTLNTLFAFVSKGIGALDY